MYINYKALFKQVRAGHRPVRAWFLRIASVHECLLSFKPQNTYNWHFMKP